MYYTNKTIDYLYRNIKKTQDLYTSTLENQFMALRCTFPPIPPREDQMILTSL